mgnify:FL=1
MKKFMYYTTRENNSLIAVNPFVEPKDYETERKDGWLFSEEELKEYLQKFPSAQFSYLDDDCKAEAYRLSDIFDFEKL